MHAATIVVASRVVENVGALIAEVEIPAMPPRIKGRKSSRSSLTSAMASQRVLATRSPVAQVGASSGSARRQTMVTMDPPITRDQGDPLARSQKPGLGFAFAVA